MSDNLQRLLGLGLFTVEGDDARLDKIRKGAVELGATIAGDGALLVDAILAATNPAANAESPSMKAAAVALANHWQSYANLSPSPIGLFRAMLTQAVLAAAADNGDTAVGLTLLLRNILPRRDLKNESEFWTEQQTRLDATYEEAAAKVWTDDYNGPAGAIPKRPAEKAGKVDRAKLEAALLGAAGPKGADGNPGANPNPNWPGGNEAWATEFAKRSAAAVGDAAEEAVAMALAGRSAIDKVIFDTFEQRLPNAEGVQRRARLLWWKEAGYSPAAECGYGELSRDLVAAIAAHDVYQIVPQVAPRSVEYFLRNTVATHAGTEAKPLAKWLSAVSAATDRGKVVDALGTAPSALLIAAVGRAAGGDIGSSALYRDAEALAPGEASVLLLREMLALGALKVEV